MKAVIIAGGFGTRLRPLSCTRPKHLLPIAGKPLLDWTLERLAGFGVKEIVFAVNYMSAAFSKKYGKSAFGMKTYYCRESKPLGTGGCVKNAEKIIGRSESFFLMNGDVLSHVDYADMLAQHEENHGVATIAVHQVDNPSRYGVVELGEGSRIRRFVEKPPLGRAPSKLINAGVYVLSPKVFNYLPRRQRVSIEREIFPALARDDELFGYRFDGLWIDVGEPSDFLRGNQLLLDSKQKRKQIASSAEFNKTAELRGPVAIGAGVRIGEKSTVGPNVTLDEDISIGRNVDIMDSVVLKRTVISDYSSIKGSIVGEGVSLGKHVKIPSNCLIGDHVIIHDNVRLSQGVTVCPHEEVAKGIQISKCVT